MKKIVSCALILAALSSLASMCFAMNGTEDLSEICPLPDSDCSFRDGNSVLTDGNTNTSFINDNAIIEGNSGYNDYLAQGPSDDKPFLDFLPLNQ